MFRYFRVNVLGHYPQVQEIAARGLDIDPSFKPLQELGARAVEAAAEVAALAAVEETAAAKAAEKATAKQA